jgi:hypothetical protein
MRHMPQLFIGVALIQSIRDDERFLNRFELVNVSKH